MAVLPIVASIGLLLLMLWHWDGSLFSYHPVLMTASFLTIPVTSINVVRWRYRSTSTTKSVVQFHLLLNTLGILAGAGGFYTIWLNKENNGWPHYLSWHSWAGIVAMAAMLVVALGGMLSVVYKGMVFRDAGHRLGGRVVVGLGGGAIALALFSRWANAALGQAVQLVTAVVLVWVVAATVLKSSPLPKARAA